MTEPIYNKGRGKAVAWLRDHASYSGDDCLTWPFSHNNQRGYCQFGLNGKLLYAHRYMCELAHGKPKPGQQARHLCGNGHNGCLNPGHLEWASNSENQRDRKKHGTHGGAIGNRSRLTAEQIKQIQALRGLTPIAALADMFGVKRGCIEYWHKKAD
jgi:hypothetical protein